MERQSVPEGVRRSAVQGSVAVIVVTFQRRDLLRLTLDSLLAQDHPADEIVVIDNASTDGTPAMLAERFPTVTHLRMEQNLGPAGALHAGLAHAHARGHRWAWTMADDDVAKPEALRLLLEAVDRIDDDRLGILGCWFDSVGDHFTFNGSLWRNRMVLQSTRPIGGPPYETDIMVFRGTLLSLTMISEIGLPREQYFIMNEEYEYCLRALWGGRRNYVLPLPLVRASEAQPPAVYPPWRGYYQARNQLAMALEHRSPGELAWWLVAQAKFLVAVLRRRDRIEERIRLRMLGGWHAVRGVTGRTLDPASWPNSSSELETGAATNRPSA
jgi:rhamnopyranosyl-N-acetylglucosaminyl-diphospho-decaprenol beta-1,3/1,4-galactofuranosyltransferase